MSGLASRQRAARKFRSSAERMLAREDAGIAFDFTDESFQGSNDRWGSVCVRDNVTLGNNFHGSPFDLLTYTSPSAKMTLGPRGILQFRPHNLALRSEEFDNASWTKSATTAVANSITAPNGTITADTVAEDATTATHAVISANIAVVSGFNYRLSVYAKAGTSTLVQITGDSAAFSGTGYANFDLSGGTVAATGGTLVASGIQSVGDGWYLCWIEVAATSTTNGSMQVCFINSSGAARRPSYAGNTGNNLYVWGAQFQRTPSPFVYVPTTSAARFGLPYEWDTTGKLRGLLVEEARTNLALRSQEFDNANWAKNGTSATSNSITAPDGTTTADTIAEATGTSAHTVESAGISVTSGTSYTLSVFAKAGTRSTLQLVHLSGSFGVNAFANFDLANGTVGTVGSAATASIVDVGNGWYRCAMTAPATATTNANPNFLMCTSTTAARFESYAGSTSNNLYLWGAQFEAGTFTSSYIPTVAASVTRAEDQITLATSAFPHSSTAGTLFAEGSQVATSVTVGGSSPTMLSISNGSSGEIIGLARTASTNESTAFTNAFSVSQSSIATGTWANGTTRKIAIAYAANDVQGSSAGTLGTQDTSAALPTVNSLRVGGRFTGNGVFTGHIRQAMYLPRRMADADLRELTRAA